MRRDRSGLVPHLSLGPGWDGDALLRRLPQGRSSLGFGPLFENAANQFPYYKETTVMAGRSDDRASVPHYVGGRLLQKGDHAAMGGRAYLVATLCIVALGASVASVASAQFRDPRRKTSVEFSVELPISAETLAAAIRRVASDGSIGGPCG